MIHFIMINVFRNFIPKFDLYEKQNASEIKY